jgi:hypothetical protein
MLYNNLEDDYKKLFPYCFQCFTSKTKTQKNSNFLKLLITFKNCYNPITYNTLQIKKIVNNSIMYNKIM